MTTQHTAGWGRFQPFARTPAKGVSVWFSDADGDFAATIHAAKQTYYAGDPMPCIELGEQIEDNVFSTAQEAQAWGFARLAAIAKATA